MKFLRFIYVLFISLIISLLVVAFYTTLIVLSITRTIHDILWEIFKSLKAEVDRVMKDKEEEK